jgi:hypothetical protein
MHRDNFISVNVDHGLGIQLVCLFLTAKKNLAPSAMAGLAANVDFSTVKLRKTGTLQQILSDTGSPVGDATANPATGKDYDTSHTTMLLQIKGERGGGRGRKGRRGR